MLAAASLSRPELTLISEALGHDARAVLEAAEQAGIVHARHGVLHFDHPLIASTLYSAAQPAKRREVHAALGAVAREPEEQARHVALATERPDEAVARLLENAAEQARLRGAPDTGAELIELALGLTADEEERPRRTVTLANLLNVAGDTARAEAVLEQAIRECPRASRARRPSSSMG